jgi:putative ABC transport system substrate-binding protein
VRRREFLGLVSGAAVGWPVAARGQPVMPVIGLLNPTSPEANADRLHAFRQGLKQTGYVEGDNVAIAYRWAENQINRLPTLATELVQRPVAVIAAMAGQAPALAAKASTTTIPIVFLVAEDPVKLGLALSLSRPGGNATGVNMFSAELTAKRLELLRELIPVATKVAVLVNPVTTTTTESTLRDVGQAAPVLGMQIQVLNASTSREIDAVFAGFVRDRPDALFVGGDPFLNSRRVQLVQLATFHKMPTAYAQRDYAEVGGLMSYGSDLADAYRQMGVYAGRVLKGAKPEELPIVQATKFELVINAQTARMLEIAVPPTLLARADDVIE